jgi:hypothetical protein
MTASTPVVPGLQRPDNLANAALRMATNGSDRDSMVSTSSFATTAYTARDSQYTMGTFEFSESGME